MATTPPVAARTAWEALGPQRADLSGFHLYDTTLRDGSQQEGLTLSVDDKLAVARLLDELGVSHIEGGWPGAVPRDTEFFRRARTELRLRTAHLAAFGATRKADTPVGEDPQVQALLDSGAGIITLVAKAHRRHVVEALRTSVEENLAMVRDTVTHLREHGREVYVDAEHFFDGFLLDADMTTAVVGEAFRAGAEVVVLCDTNGGMLPHQVTDVVEELRGRLAAEGLEQCRLGIHTHNDTGCAVANAMAAVRAGADHVQGCVNGYGERTGNADLLTMAGNLQFKLDVPVLTVEQMADATRIAAAIGEVVNMPASARAPYVGASAFAHKAGLHASALRVDPDLYQHLDPRSVGNDMRMIISDMAGRASIELKGRELGFDLAGSQALLGRLAATVKGREAVGYSYEAADASFEMLLLDEMGRVPSYAKVHSWRTSTHQLADGSLETEAVVRLLEDESGAADGRDRGQPSRSVSEGVAAVGRSRQVTIAEGNGPVHALDSALRDALMARFPQIADFELTDFKVRILDAQRGTDATTRVLVTTQIPGKTFTTVGVGPNMIEAAWEAIFDAYNYGLFTLGV